MAIKKVALKFKGRVCLQVEMRLGKALKGNMFVQICST